MVRDEEFKAFGAFFGSSLWKMLGFEAARRLYKLKKWSGIRNLRLLEAILAHLCAKMVGFKAARPLYKLKKWSGIRNLKLLEPILAHLFGRCSGLRLRDLSTI